MIRETFTPRETVALTRWSDHPEAVGLLASIAKRPPLSVHFRDDWQQGFEFVGMRVDRLRTLYNRFGEEVMALCDQAYFAAGRDGAAQVEAYAPMRDWAENTVDAVVRAVLERAK